MRSDDVISIFQYGGGWRRQLTSFSSVTMSFWSEVK